MVGREVQRPSSVEMVESLRILLMGKKGLVGLKMLVVENVENGCYVLFLIQRLCSPRFRSLILLVVGTNYLTVSATNDPSASHELTRFKRNPLAIRSKSDLRYLNRELMSDMIPNDMVFKISYAPIVLRAPIPSDNQFSSVQSAR